MFARAAFRSTPAFRSTTRQYSSKAPREPLQAASPWGRIILVAGAAGAGYYAYTLYGAGGDKAATPFGAPNVAPLAAKKVLTGGDQGFVPLRVESVEVVNDNTKRVKFAFDDDDAVSGLHIASALLTKFKAPDSDKPVTRPYTPISNEDQKGYLELLVKKYPNGPMSSHIHDLRPGQTLEFKGPLPKYPWTENKHEHIALVAGGTGITPMFQLARAIFNNPNDKTNVTLVFGNLSEKDILLKKEFEELENTYPNRFRAFYVLDKPPKDSKVFTGGHITKELLKTVLPPPDKGEAVKVFVCGPPGLYKAISGGKKSPADQGELAGYLKELGYSKDQVFKF